MQSNSSIAQHYSQPFLPAHTHTHYFWISTYHLSTLPNQISQAFLLHICILQQPRTEHQALPPTCAPKLFESSHW